MDETLEKSDADGHSAVLQENFRRYMGDRTVARLRHDMALSGILIGSSAIQLARHGSLGLRLGTLTKFARFFGCEVADLIGQSPGAVAWPFKTLTPAEYNRAPDTVRDAAERILLAVVGRAE